MMAERRSTLRARESVAAATTAGGIGVGGIGVGGIGVVGVVVVVLGEIGVVDGNGR